MIELRAQPGPQEDFLATEADVAVIGGAAGGTKTFSLLMEPMRHRENALFRSMFFRRTTPQITNPGGMWDTSFQIYPGLGGKPREHKLTWSFPGGMWGKMSHLEYERNILDHHSAQYPYIAFDELAQFTRKQFFYLFSRNRSVSGIRGYVRGGTNPVPKEDPIGGWMHELVGWYIAKDGFPIRRRSGVVRYFIIEDDKVCWVDKDWKHSETGEGPVSFTFIPSKLTDNRILMQRDPSYARKLNMLSRIDRMRLKEGNWHVREEDGMFETDWFGIVDRAPKKALYVRYWDRAATDPKKAKHDPDWTAGALCCIHGGDLYICDIHYFRAGPAENERRIKKISDVDGPHTIIGIEEEPGSSGKDSVHHYQTKVLTGRVVRPDRPSGSKIERCKPWNAMSEFGHVYLVRGSWNYDFLNDAANYPNGRMDLIDAVSGAYKLLTGPGIARFARVSI